MTSFKLFIDAIVSGRLADVKRLMKDSYLNRLYEDWTNPLHLAAAPELIDERREVSENENEASCSDANRKKRKHRGNEYSEIPKKKIKQETSRDDEKRTILEYLILEGAQVNGRDSDKRTPLHVAARYNHLDIIKCLISHDASIDAADPLGQTSVHIAANHGFSDVLNYLLRKGGDCKMKDMNGCTPMHLAAKQGNLNAVEILMIFGANVNVGNAIGRSPFHFAVLHGHLDVVKYFANKSLDINKVDLEGLSAIHFAVSSGKFEVVEFLISLDIDIAKADYCGRTALHYAAGRCDLITIQYLTKHGASVNVTDNFRCAPIHYVCAICPEGAQIQVDYATVIQHLIDKGADIEVKIDVCNGKCNRPQCTSKFVRKLYVQELSYGGIHNGRALSHHGMRPVHIACASGNAEALERLLDAGCMIDERDDDCRLPDDCKSWGNEKDKCCRMVAKHREKRSTTEYSVWHRKNYVDVWRRYKIYDFTAVAASVQKKIRPLSKTFMFFDNPKYPDDVCIQPNVTVLRTVRNEQSVKEYVVIGKEDTMADVLLYLGDNQRRYSIKLFYPDLKSSIPLHMPVKDFTLTHSYVAIRESDEGPDPVGWSNHYVISVNLPAEKRLLPFAGYEGKLNILWYSDRYSESDETAITFFGQSAGTAVSEYLKGNQSRVRSVSSDSTGNLVADPNGESDGCADVVRKILKETHINVRPVASPYRDLLMVRRQFSTIDAIKTNILSKLNFEGRLILLVDHVVADGMSRLATDSVVEYIVIHRFTEIKKMEQIGAGSLGMAYKYECKRKIRFAKKIKTNPIGLDGKIFEEMSRIAAVPVHERIIGYDYLFDIQGCLYLSMPFMETGSLNKYVSEREECLHESEIRRFCQGILEGLSHLHSHKITHRRLKGSNILLDDSLSVKLSDFGLPHSEHDTNKHHQSINWMAPEILVETRPQYDSKSDIWSFGATVMEMITGLPPHAQLSDSKIRIGLLMTLRVECKQTETFSDEIGHFIGACLQENPHERPTCTQLLTMKPLV